MCCCCLVETCLGRTRAFDSSPTKTLLGKSLNVHTMGVWALLGDVFLLLSRACAVLKEKALLKLWPQNTAKLVTALPEHDSLTTQNSKVGKMMLNSLFHLPNGYNKRC
ncbi:hypothetical protein KIL84_005950 [Mauremys mutica]|uniref:Uncharacterized protein n=1 Tax=Mauremys mutica TaxID=74926 RepID=A0A9D3XIX7_9SAUR|nr:hypothetical protein KIL84_005950 [Mauremys mutica]